MMAAMPPGDAGPAQASDAGGDAAGSAEPQAMLGDPDLGSVGLGSGGIGVSDLEAATKFFVDLVGMKVHSDVRREDRVERVLTLGPAGKPTLTLMHYDDGRNTKDIAAKMVFYAQSPSAAISKIRDGGYDVILSGAIGVGQVYGFDGYVLEFLQNANGPLFISIAFAVTDLDKTVTFYTDAFGLMSTGSYYAGSLQEEFVQAPAGGAALVVQHYLSGDVNYKSTAT
jgi:catechol 2,3-dioxygenase-like lactoylglutathione lyase family enzyme